MTDAMYALLQLGIVLFFVLAMTAVHLYNGRANRRQLERMRLRYQPSHQRWGQDD